jgi:molybdenum cofactor cytidylyltransferase
MLAAAILAAGESRRMGTPKALLPYRGKTFLEHLIEVTRHPRVGVTRIVLGAHADEITRHLSTASSFRGTSAPEGRGFNPAESRTLPPGVSTAEVNAPQIVVNENWRQGQLSSIQAAIRSLLAVAGLPSVAGSSAQEGLLLCPVDHPLVSADLVSRLIAAFDASDKLIVLPTFNGRRGHPLIFRSSLYAELLAASPAVGARQVVWAHAAEILEVPTDEEGVVLNLNDPATLALARALGDETRK